MSVNVNGFFVQALRPKSEKDYTSDSTTKVTDAFAGTTRFIGVICTQDVRLRFEQDSTISIDSDTPGKLIVASVDHTFPVTANTRVGYKKESSGGTLNVVEYMS